MAKAKSIVDETVDTEAEPLPVVKPTGNLVEVTITKLGDGKVSTGERDETGDIMAARGEKLMVSAEVVASLEARGFAEAD